MVRITVNSSEKRYKKSKDSNKNIVLTLRTNEEKQSKESHFLNLRGMPDKPSKRRDRYFVKQVAQSGALMGILLPGELKRASEEGVLPPPYMVDYKIPLDIGGTSNISNMYIVDQNVADLMDFLYWRQIRLEVNALKEHQQQQKNPSKIAVSFAKLPQVFTQDEFLSYILAHERKGLQKYLMEKKLQETDTVEKVSIENFPNGDVLWRLKSPEPVPEGTQMTIVKVRPRLWVERSRWRSEYMALRPEFIKISLRRGDFDDLSDDIRKKIMQTGHVPSFARRTCHHILPLVLGGENRLNNLCWLDEKIHSRLHAKFIAPLEDRLHGLTKLPENLFFEIPVPVGAKVPQYKLVKGKLQLVDSTVPDQLRKTLKKVSAKPVSPVRFKKKGKKQKGRRPMDDQNEA